MIRGWQESEAAGEARDCMWVGVVMAAVGLLYWGLLAAYAASLPVGWFANVHVAGHDPLGAVKDPLMDLIWVLYGLVTVGLLRRGLRTVQ